MRLASAATIADATTRAAHGRSMAEALLVLAALLVFIVLVWIGARPVSTKPISTDT